MDKLRCWDWNGSVDVENTNEGFVADASPVETFVDGKAGFVTLRD